MCGIGIMRANDRAPYETDCECVRRIGPDMVTIKGTLVSEAQQYTAAGDLLSAIDQLSLCRF